MKSQQPTYIQLDNAEDVASIRDRLSFIRGQQVLLIWPEKGTALTRKLDLVLIQREARRRVLQIALVTHDTDVIKHATELGISTFETIGDAEKNRWKRGRTRVFVNRYHKPEESPEPDDLMPVASRVRKPRKRIPPLMQLTVRIAVLTVVTLAILLTLYIVVPSATVTIVMDQELITVDTTITADRNALDVDVERRIIPATQYTADVQTILEVETTGIETSSSIRALGEVRLTNLTNAPITVPANTQMRTNTGQPVTFETSLATTVPANGSVERVGIIASEGFEGEIGNVSARTINTVVGELSDSIAVINDTATTGGIDEDYAIVTPDDMQRVLDLSRQSLQAIGYTEMEAELTEQQTIILDSINIPDELLRDDWINFSHSIDDRTETVSLDIRVIVEALAIDDRLAQQIVFAQISSDKPDDMILNPESFLYRRGEVTETGEDNAVFEAFGEGIASAQVDTYSLQTDLTRRPLDEAQRLIVATVDVAPNSQPIIEVSPSWLTHMPILPIRINIVIEGTE
ncbi:MAG: hypothetical protein AAFV93_11480 [Chloroflexota bacterium]